MLNLPYQTFAQYLLRINRAISCMSQFYGLNFNSSSECDNDAIILESLTSAAAAEYLPPLIDSSKVISAKLFMGMRYVMYCHSCISMNESLWMIMMKCKEITQIHWLEWLSCFLSVFRLNLRFLIRGWQWYHHPGIPNISCSCRISPSIDRIC